MDNNNKNQPIKLTPEIVKKAIGERTICELDPYAKCDYCGDCLMCDINPTKICNNCGKCLDQFNTDEKGFVSIKVDKIIREGDVSLDDLYKQYGLDGDDDPEIQIKPTNE